MLDDLLTTRRRLSAGATNALAELERSVACAHALSLPCHRGDERAVSLMVWHAAMRDDAVLNVACQIEQHYQNNSKLQMLGEGNCSF